jgi:hypothetical protein
MQDLGKITIDINEGGGSSAGGASGGMSSSLPKLSSVSEMIGPVISALASAAKVVAGLAIKAAKQIYEAFMKLRQFVLAFVDDIREYSPAVQLADLGNEMAMIGEKMRAANMGGKLAANVVSAEGEVERSMFRIKSVLATAGAAIVGPIMRQLARALQYLETWLPKILDTIGKILEWLGSAIQTASKLLPPNPGGFFKELGSSIEKIGKDIREINLNTKPNVNFSELNKPFLDDLRLMGARV